jgi:hypothetical protein
MGAPVGASYVPATAPKCLTREMLACMISLQMESAFDDLFSASDSQTGPVC